MQTSIDQIHTASQWLMNQTEADRTAFDVALSTVEGTYQLQVDHTTAAGGTQTIRIKPNGDIVL